MTYLLATRLGVEPEVRFLGDLATGAFSADPMRAGDWLRIAELVAGLRDLPLGTVDASIVAAAERLGITKSRRSTAGTSASSAPATRRLSRCCHDPPRRRGNRPGTEASSR